MKGMGLLNLKTVFSREKTKTRVVGKFNKLDGVLSKLSGVSFSGYEIHMGVTKLTGPIEGEQRSLTMITDVSGQSGSKADGMISGNILGSYVHGIFDEQQVVSAIIQCLFVHKGLDPLCVKSINYKEYKEIQYNKLAAEISKTVDIETIVKIMEEGV